MVKQRDFLKLIGLAMGGGLAGQLIRPSPALADTTWFNPNVGIGTSSPGYALEIYQNAAPQLCLRGSWSGGAGYLRFQEWGATGFWEVITRNGGSSQVGNMDWYCNPDGGLSPSHYHQYATFMQNNSLDTSPGSVYFPGSVGIGTTPTYVLDVLASPGSGWNQGPARISGSNGDTLLHILNTSTGGREYMLDSTGSQSGFGGGKFVIADVTALAPRLVIDQSGNVGVGIISPTAAFHLGAGVFQIASTKIADQNGCYYA